MGLKRALCYRLYLTLIRYESMHWIKVRRLLFDHMLGRKHRNLWIHPGAYVEGVSGLKLGDDVSINRNCNISGEGGLTIGDNVSIGHSTSVLTTEHGVADPDVPIKHQPIEFKAVTIGDNVWIGARACIIAGVTLAKGTIVGAGSVVTRSVTEENCTIGGVPARIIKRRA